MSRKRSEQNFHPATVLTSNQATLMRSAISLESVERDRLAQILDDYLSAIERGASITPERLLAENPADAEKLRLYLQGLEMLNVAARAESILVPSQATFDTPAERSAQSTAGSQGADKRRSRLSSISSRSIPRLFLGEGDSVSANPFNALRHSRIRAAALCCTIWWSTIVVVLLVTARVWAWVPAVVTLVLGGIFCWLTVRPRIGAPLLRCIEIALFGTMAAGFGIITYTFQCEGAAKNDAVAIALATKNADIAAMTLLFPYAMLIPNSWQRALPMISVLALYPFAVTVFFMTKHPEALSLTASHTVFDEGGLNLFKMLIAGSLALYGVHVLDTLRIEAFEARRLNQYHMGERIGEGGMGEVYLAEHRLLKRPCAIKLIRTDAANDRDALRRFEREVRSTARLSHPNIIQIFDYGQTDDATFYYVMEYLHGLSLAELVERHGPQPAGRKPTPPDFFIATSSRRIFAWRRLAIDLT